MNADQRGKILVVDDEPINIKILVQVLSDEYDIMVARSGQQALSIATSTQPDLILLDVVMPEMDGFEVCSRLKQQGETARIPVIFITALGDAKAETQGLEIGAVDYIAKPISPPVVKVRVRNQFELKRAHEELMESHEQLAQRTQDLEIANAKLQLLSERDGLTGIANRRKFDTVWESEWQRAARQHLPLAVALIDVDHFKAYNDHYGHQAGDDCLRQVAQALAATAQRVNDLVARYGGEEFVVVLPGLTGPEAFQVAQKLVAAVADCRIPHAHSSAAPVVTVSIGVAARVPEPDTQPGSLLENADATLYQAKHSGRNQALLAI